jgi:hypothetical protein
MSDTGVYASEFYLLACADSGKLDILNPENMSLPVPQSRFDAPLSNQEEVH